MEETFSRLLAQATTLAKAGSVEVQVVLTSCVLVAYRIGRIIYDVSSEQHRNTTASSVMVENWEWCGTANHTFLGVVTNREKYFVVGK